MAKNSGDKSADSVTLQTRLPEATVVLVCVATALAYAEGAAEEEFNALLSPPLPPLLFLCLCQTQPAHRSHWQKGLGNAWLACHLAWLLAISFTLPSVRTTALLVGENVCVCHGASEEMSFGPLSVLLKDPDQVRPSRLGPEATSTGDQGGRLRLLQRLHRVQDASDPGPVQAVPRGEGVVASVDSSQGHRQQQNQGKLIISNITMN